MKIIELFKKNKSFICYLIFGVCTTLVNIISYYLCAHLLHLSTTLSTCLAWVLSVLFAYFTNRKWVFESKNKNILKEIIIFFSCRLLTGIFDLLFMYIFVDKLHFNDLMIKLISNIIVIALNYIFSKLVIFNKNKKERSIKGIIKENKNLIENTMVIIFLFFLASLFMLNSPLNIWQGADTLTDSSVFKSVALMMDNGFMPYKDIFDHKGPIIYLINFLGMQISYYRGVWVLEVLMLFITFYFMYKIAKLVCNKFYSCLSVLCATPILFKYFEQGNLVEEYAMPFIAISLYLFLDYFLNKKINKPNLMICGFCFGTILLLRPNMISVWFVFCCAVFVHCLKKHNIKEVFNFVLYFLIGCVLILLPILLWLLYNHAFMDFIDNYLLFNFSYSARDFSYKINVFFTFFNEITFLFSIIICFYLICKKKETRFLHISYAIYLLITLVLISTSGATYGHYGLVLIPAFVYPIASFLKIVENDLKKEEKAITLFVILYLLGTFVLPNWLNLLAKTGTLYQNRDKNNHNPTTSQICSIIENNTSKDDKISVYGNWNIIYVLTQRLPASKYSYQYPISQFRSSIMDEYFEDLEREKPKIIVVSINLDKSMEEFLSRNNYKKEQINNKLIYYLDNE